MSNSWSCNRTPHLRLLSVKFMNNDPFCWGWGSGWDCQRVGENERDGALIICLTSSPYHIQTHSLHSSFTHPYPPTLTHNHIRIISTTVVRSSSILFLSVLWLSHPYSHLCTQHLSDDFAQKLYSIKPQKETFKASAMHLFVLDSRKHELSFLYLLLAVLCLWSFESDATRTHARLNERRISSNVQHFHNRSSEYHCIIGQLRNKMRTKWSMLSRHLLFNLTHMQAFQRKRFTDDFCHRWKCNSHHYNQSSHA